MIFSSPYPDISIPEQPLTEFVLQRAVELGDKPALIEGLSDCAERSGKAERILTYGQLADSIGRVASSLAARGFSKGDVFAIYSPNIPEYAIAFHAVVSLGGVISTVNPSYTAQELVYQLNHTGAKYLLTTPDLLAPALEAVNLSEVKEVFVFGEAVGATSFSVLLHSEGEVPQVHINPKEDLMVLLYSGGTTGLPKGVMHTHYTFGANFYQFQNCEPITSADRLIGVLPFFHAYGMLMLNYSLACGATIVTMQGFDLETFLSLIQQHQITRIHVVPPILLPLVKQSLVEKYDLSSLRVITSAAAPLSRELIAECEKRLPHCIIKQIYGTTETCVSLSAPDECYKTKPGSVGKIISSVECQIVDIDTQKPLTANQSGEMWIRGPQVMKGYLNNPEATANAIDEDGWYHTGDIVYADEDGYVYIVDRIKELIKCNGYSIAPAELEAILLTHPAVADACVIKSPHPTNGEVPKAFVVLKSAATPEQIMEFVAGQVASYKRIRRLEIVDKIPKSTTGKILRRLLVEQELLKIGEQSKNEQPLSKRVEFLQQIDDAFADQRQELLISYIQEQIVKVLEIDSSQYLDPEKPLNALRLDSLMNIDLKNRIDTELGVNIPIEIFIGNLNISQLANLVLQQLATQNTFFSQPYSTDLAPDLSSEAVLDSTIFPEYPIESFVSEPAAIFLTGSTGFLGAFLLQELLLKTQARVYCLVRSADTESGKMRIQNNLESYGIWNEDLSARIIPVLGDLSQPLLGLSSADFQKMSSLIDVIYHNAAWINYVYPYSALKPTNVLGTQEILRLASQTKTKPVHYISTIAVFESPAYWGKIVAESDPLAHSEGMKLAYSQSKWVAEKLMMIASQRGIPVSIYRPPFISGHSQTGAWYKDDVICRTIKGCIQMGNMTDITDRLDLAPVDYLSQSIIYLSKQKDSLGKAFHLTNPQPSSWSELTYFIRSLGYSIQHISYQDWQIQLSNAVRSKENPLYHLLPFFLKKLPQEQLPISHKYQQLIDPQLSCSATHIALAGSSISCPPVNKELLNTYFSYFIRSGWLDF
ncbi:thioester reductase domain-containing protein [Scytonema sp. HK-05]|uniref:thioester reductase domain-containing protein n=1 Tax=Scytonema sp. HK-05 TaxID=1137095 RepID=UPI000937C1A0|nr:thioester reductase domain-containing protein [Scytonema sp. HK-05]OKH53680.1 thioester reductase [Scytonema sp. HK-05]BAY49687.1 thioester reductase domain-containing protein [Scytonema sp. HK-05]